MPWARNAEAPRTARTQTFLDSSCYLSPSLLAHLTRQYIHTLTGEDVHDDERRNDAKLLEAHATAKSATAHPTLGSLHLCSRARAQQRAAAAFAHLIVDVAFRFPCIVQGALAGRDAVVAAMRQRIVISGLWEEEREILRGGVERGVCCG